MELTLSVKNGHIVNWLFFLCTTDFWYSTADACSV